MGRHGRVYTEVEIDVDLADFETDDLLEELQSRRAVPNMADKDLLEDMYYAYTTNQSETFDRLLHRFFYETLGRIV